MVRAEQTCRDGAQELCPSPGFGAWAPSDPPAGLAEGPAGKLTSWEPICYEIYEMLCNCEEPKDRLS